MTFIARLLRFQEFEIRRDFLGAACFAVAAMSGKLAATKLLGSSLPPPLLEIRLWTTIAAAGLLLPLARSIHWNSSNTYLFGSIFVLATYSMLRAPFGATDLTALKFADLIYLIILSYLMLIIASDAALLMACGASILLLSSILFVFALTGIATNPDLNGAGWAAIGGTLTFFRLEFLGFSCALWMLLRNKCRPASGAILLSVFLFATLASLSKAAYGATTIVLLFLAAGLSAQRKWRTLVMLVAAALTVVIGWHFFLSSKFFTRTSSAFTSQVTDPTIQDLEEGAKRHQFSFPLDPLEPAPSNRSPGDLDRLNKSDFLAPGFSFSTEFRWCTIDAPVGSEKGTITCHKKTMVDRTQRLFFLFKALENPTMFGHGLASFRVLALNPNAGYQLEQYTYPHNVIVEVLYDTGIVGIGLLAVALMFSVAAFFRFVNREPASLALGGFALFILISSLAGGDFYDFRLYWLAALILSTPNGRPQKAR